MKSASPTYQALLYQTGSWFAADLVTVYLSDQTLRLTTGDTDLTVSGTVWSSSSGTLLPSDNRQALGSEVTTLELIVGGANVVLSGGQTLNQAAVLGRFDGVRATVERCYMPTWGDTTAGKAMIFDGLVDRVEPASTELRLGLRSMADLLKLKFPQRMYQPSCPYVFGDANCGVNMSLYTTASLVASGSTASVVALSGVSAPTDTFKGGVFTVTDGALAGLKRVIATDTDVGADHQLTLSPTLPSAPASGTAVSVTRGCDKLRTTCNGYSNLPHFGGFADVPAPKAS